MTGRGPTHVDDVGSPSATAIGQHQVHMVGGQRCEVVDEVCAVGLRDRRLRRLNRKEGPIGTGRRLAGRPR